VGGGRVALALSLALLAPLGAWPATARAKKPTPAARPTPWAGVVDAVEPEARAAAAWLAPAAAGGAPVDVAVSVRVEGGGRAARAARRLEAALVARLGGLPGLGRVVALPRGDGTAAAQARFGAWLVVRVRADGDGVRADVIAVRLRADVWRKVVRGGLAELRRRGTVKLADAAARPLLGLPGAAQELGRAKKLELDLGAPVLALAAADTDGDGVDELYALTPDEVVALERPGPKKTLAVRQRVALPGDAPVPRPREPVGTLVALDADGDGRAELHARTSAHAAGLRLVASGPGGALAPGGAPPAAWTLCAGARGDGGVTLALAELARGVAFFAGASFTVDPADGVGAPAAPSSLVAAACGDAPGPRDAPWFALVDAEGAITLLGGAPTGKTTGAGAALALADVDGDQRPELVTTAYRAPGDGDVLVVWRVGDGGALTELGRGESLAGGIAAVTAGDLDGDGVAEPVAAARLPGSTRTDLWVWP
jgi:hypothetical protein